jgi:hypothetical protein
MSEGSERGGAAGDGASLPIPSGWLRPLAIGFAMLNALAAAAAVFGAFIYIGEAEDRRLQRDTFEALAVEMLYARLDRARQTRSNASDVLRRLNGFGVRVRDIDLTNLVFIEPPSRLDPIVYLRGGGYFIACPIGDEGYLGVDDAGTVTNCGVRGADVELRNAVQFDLVAASLVEPTFYCRAGSRLRFAFGSFLERPTFHCRREQVQFVQGSVEPTDARWCHPDDDPSEPREGGPPVYASGPCAGEIYPGLDRTVSEGPETP